MHKFWFVFLILFSSAASSGSARDRDNAKLGVSWELSDELWIKGECVTIGLSSVAQHHTLELTGINILVVGSDTRGTSLIPLSTKRDGSKYYAKPCLSLATLEQSVFHFMYKRSGETGSVAHGVLLGQHLYPKAKELVSFYTEAND